MVFLARHIVSYVLLKNKSLIVDKRHLIVRHSWDGFFFRNYR